MIIKIGDKIRAKITFIPDIYKVMDITDYGNESVFISLKDGSGWECSKNKKELARCIEEANKYKEPKNLIEVEI